MSKVMTDSLGEVVLPDGALYGPQTQRAVNNFKLSGQAMPWRFLAALIEIKRAAAQTHLTLGELDDTKAEAIIRAADQLLADKPLKAFPVEVFQTGSGTSSNMNVNEVIANLAGNGVSPNDDVNMGQSSNDTVPAALQLSVLQGLEKQLLPRLHHLAKVIEQKAASLDGVVKTGRTHLMDAMPLTFGQELTTWQVQLEGVETEIRHAIQRLSQLPLGGTAVGTGINAHPQLADGVCVRLCERLHLHVEAHDWPFAHMAAQEAPLAASAALRQLAVVLMKVSNDLRWMNSGPLAGLGEISLPALQPGSSIMPGKVNPVIPEALAMVCAQVMGLDAANAIAAQSGNFQLNVMLPLLVHNLNQMVDLLANGCEHLADKAIKDFTVNQARVDESLEKNPILVTALNSEIGYLQAAAIAKKAYAEGRPILEVAKEETDLGEAQLKDLLDPAKLCRPFDE
ncbi:class II fumarate hydratase [Gallaecimonas kandeliae]|uniref:class II fumarate hydratase n=1 Tax=Gallaecimonas kandeliae TaxID=3029055 RepID=UPI0026481006|nr:class II fumarate hydratase [Gallaecimonas kandeliae]WKE66808.1 class II fumarate hydratase [Gallaecimonas kandeliae]